MAISVFGKFLNMIPSTIVDGADVSMVILVDPPEIPPVFMKNKGVLNTTEKTITILGDDGITVAHTFDISTTDLGPINEEIAALKTRVGTNEGDIAQIKIDVTGNGASITALTGRVDELSDNALIRSGNDYDAKSGTISNLSSGGDTDTKAANIGDVKRISTSGSGLKPVDDTWDMLGYPVLNIGTSTISSSAATYGQVSTVDGKVDANAGAISNLGDTVGQQDTQIKANTSELVSVKSTADAADTLSKANATRIDNLPPAPDLSKYAELGASVNFDKITATDLDFSAKGGNASITNDHNINITVDGNINAAFKSSGMRLLKPIDGNGQTQNNLGDIHLNSGKKIYGSDTGALEIRNIGSIKRNNSNDNDSVSLGSGSNTYKSNGHVFKDNSGNETFFIGNNVNVNNRVLQNVKKSESNADATNLGHIKELIEASSGGGAIEFKDVKKGVTGSPTYYYHNGENHLYIEYAGDGGTVALDTMRSGVADQVEDMTVIHNTTDTECTIRLFFNGSSVTHAVPARSFLHGWANRTIGEWVTVTSKDPSYVISEHLIVKSTDLSWALSSDPRTNTQRLIAAAPPVCTIIGRHSPSDSTKEKIVSVGDSNRLESQISIFVINKQSTGHATGICSSEENSGKTWSRILDGKRGAWFTNDTANSRMASGDIDPSEYPEDQLFFTTDQGIMETYLDESAEGEVGVIKLRVLNGYNTPKNSLDIEALEVQTEKNRSVTHYFINEPEVSYDWPDESRRPLVEVQVLNTTQTINNSSLSVTDNGDHTYSGTYNAVGAVAINASGNWSATYVYHNAYKHESQDYYVVFNQASVSWNLIQSASPHTSIGEHAAAVTVQLGAASSLPASFGDYVIDPNFSDIDSLEFLNAEVPVQYDDTNARVIINFNGSKPSGFVVLK